MDGSLILPNKPKCYNKWCAANGLGEKNMSDLLTWCLQFHIRRIRCTGGIASVTAFGADELGLRRSRAAMDHETGNKPRENPSGPLTPFPKHPGETYYIPNRRTSPQRRQRARLIGQCWLVGTRSNLFGRVVFTEAGTQINAIDHEISQMGERRDLGNAR